MIRELDIADFSAIQEKSPRVQVWDVRDKKSFSEGHIVGAVNKPIEHLDGTALVNIPKSEPVYVLCGGGTKAGRAIALLESLDPTREYVELKGGTRGARSVGFSIVVGE
jgi:phage shock protein E